MDAKRKLAFCDTCLWKQRYTDGAADEKRVQCRHTARRPGGQWECMVEPDYFCQHYRPDRRDEFVCGNCVWFAELAKSPTGWKCEHFREAREASASPCPKFEFNRYAIGEDEDKT